MTIPTNLQTIEVTGTFLDSAGNPLSGSLTFTPPPELVDLNTAIMYSQPQIATLASDGTFTITLIATDNPTLVPAGWGWTVTENVRSTRSYTIYTPHSLGDSVDLSTLTPLPTLDGSTTTETAVGAISPGYAALAYNNTFSGNNVFDGPTTFTGEVTVPTPVYANDPVNKAYADALALGLSIKPSCQEATAAPLPSNTYVNGSSGVGATLTATANGALTVDGVAVSLGDRVLVQNEAAAADNGIYTVTATGSSTAPYVLTRATDMNTGAQVPGAFVFVENGSTNAGAGFVVAAQGPYTIGTTAITWSQFSGTGEINAGPGLTKSGNTLSLAVPVSVADGGTGSVTQNFVDITTNQTVAGNKTFSGTTAFGSLPTVPGGPLVSLDWVNVKTKGAKGDLTELLSCAISASSNTLVATGASFATTDVGKSIFIPGAGTSGGWLSTTISGYTSATTVTLAAAASTTVSAVEGYYGTDDTAVISATLTAAAPGTSVYVPPGVYLTSASLPIPPLVRLFGSTHITLNLFTDPGTTSRIVASPAWAPGSTAGMVQIASKTPGGWSQNTVSCGLQGLVLDGSLNSSTSLNGIYMIGPVYDVALDHVFVWKAPHNGIAATSTTESGIIPTFPYHHKYTQVTVANSGNTGLNLTNFTDSTYVNCMAFGNGGVGWNLQNCSNSTWTTCRAEWNLSYGVMITGASGSMSFTGCTSDQNAREAFYITAATGQSGSSGGGIVITGGKLHSDGNAAVAGHTYAVNVINSTVPVSITGVNMEVGQASSSFYPAYAVAISNSSNVTVTGCTLQGVTGAWLDGGGNSNIKRTGCLGITGTPGAQVTVSLPHLPYILARVPQDQSLQAWNYDPLTAASSTAMPIAGTGYWLAIQIREPIYITTVEMDIITAGSGLTAGQCFAGLFSSSGAQVGVTADQSTAWATSGSKAMALTGSTSFYNATLAAYYLPAGLYGLLLFFNGTTGPAFLRAGLVNTVGASEPAQSTAANYMFATNGTALTVMPSTVTLSSNSRSGAQQYWFGLY